MSEKSHQPQEEQEFIYSGTSMVPTFRPGQSLYVHPADRDLLPGDVVVFKRAGRYVVHRLTSSGTTGYHTRGDHNRIIDPALVAPSEIIGRVERVGGMDEDQKVQNGRRGLWRARLGWSFRWIVDHLRPILGWPYRQLKRSKFICKFWKPAILRVQLQTEKDFLVKYIHRGRKVATWDAARELFVCRKPYDLVLFPPNKDHPHAPDVERVLSR